VLIGEAGISMKDIFDRINEINRIGRQGNFDGITELTEFFWEGFCQDEHEGHENDDEGMKIFPSCNSCLSCLTSPAFFLPKKFR
jgi:hypothetical protein